MTQSLLDTPFLRRTQGSTISWFSRCLTGSSFSVYFAASSPSPQSLPVAVPQGSSWFLFSIYTQHFIQAQKSKNQLLHVQIISPCVSTAQKPSSPTPHSSIQMPTNTSCASQIDTSSFTDQKQNLDIVLYTCYKPILRQSMAIPSFHCSSKKSSHYP